MNRGFVAFGLTLLLFANASLCGDEQAAISDSTSNQLDPIALVVMDPLAAPLSCPCVEGYAQRKYEVLAKYLQASLGREVKLGFGGALKTAMKKTNSRADIVIGKQSVVMFDAKDAKVNVTPISRLTDRNGSTTQYGMIVVNKDDPAKSVEDLDGYTIIFGPAEAEEKHAAALKLLSDAKISIPSDDRKIDLACSDGACKVVDLGPESQTAAVISSYAQPLLEGCGTIKKGDLRVVAKTSKVPFVTLFVNDQMSETDRSKLTRSLAKIPSERGVLEALESLVGFMPIKEADKAAPAKPSEKETAAVKKK